MTISDPGIGGRKGGSVGICQKGARNGMMGMEAAVGWLVGWLEDKWWGDRRREGERRKGGSNDAFTFKSYFNSWLRLERKAYPATFIGQYFLRLIGCTCSAFPFPLSLSAKTNSYAIAVMSSAPQSARSRGSDFSLATPLIGISKLESAPATGANGTLPPLPKSHFNLCC